MDIAKLKEGDNEAVKALYDETFHHLRYFCEQIVEDVQEAEDVATSAFVKYWELRANFDSVKEIKSFLYKTSRNICINSLKHRKVQRKYIKAIGGSLTEDERLRIEKYTYEAVIFERLFEQIDLLPAQCKEAFRLCYFSGMDRKEVAERLSISINTVNRHCSNAIQKLRIIFGEEKLVICLYIWLLNA